MTESEAIVTQQDGEDVWVDVQSGCSSCGDNGSCGLSDGKGRSSHRVRNTIGARVGDSVILSVPEGTVLRAVLYCYLFPLVITLAGAAVGMQLGREPGAIVGTAGGLLIGWFVMRQAGRREPGLSLRLKHAVVHLHRNPKT